MNANTSTSLCLFRNVVSENVSAFTSPRMEQTGKEQQQQNQIMWVELNARFPFVHQWRLFDAYTRFNCAQRTFTCTEHMYINYVCRLRAYVGIGTMLVSMESCSRNFADAYTKWAPCICGRKTKTERIGWVAWKNGFSAWPKMRNDNKN